MCTVSVVAGIKLANYKMLTNISDASIKVPVFVKEEEKQVRHHHEIGCAPSES